jgi:hypothetical protein
MTSPLRMALIATLVSLAFLPGCTRGLPTCRPSVKIAKIQPDYFRVDYRVRAEGGIVPRAEVRAAARFDTLRGLWKEGTAAVRLPDRCKQEGAGGGTGALGQAAIDKSIMSTECGFWLAEIERALVKAKYKVVSWNALSQVEHTKGVPTYVAARDLGADFVFLVNSLEAGTSKLGKAYTESLRFFDSDDAGNRGSPRELDDDERRSLKDFVQARTRALRNDKLVIGIKAILDMTALDTKTGEAVWFYLKQEAKPVPIALDRRFLFGQYKNKTGWWPAIPSGYQAQIKAAEARRSSVDEESGEGEPAPEDAYNAEVNELVRTVVDDFMTRFRGQGG